jgi:hypothetical protein
MEFAQEENFRGVGVALAQSQFSFHHPYVHPWLATDERIREANRIRERMQTHHNGSARALGWPLEGASPFAVLEHTPKRRQQVGGRGHVCLAALLGHLPAGHKGAGLPTFTVWEYPALGSPRAGDRALRGCFEAIETA